MDDDLGLGRDAAQLARDARAQDRALADAALAVEHGQARGEQVRDEDVALPATAEEEERVDLGVVERAQALVRPGRCRDCAHAEASAGSSPA